MYPSWPVKRARFEQKDPLTGAKKSEPQCFSPGNNRSTLMVVGFERSRRPNENSGQFYASAANVAGMGFDKST